MDNSPLTLAQSHARKASKANTPLTAIEEHDLAAGQFASAASGTDSSEAFRTLKLLEQHHEKLSQLLKTQNPYFVSPDTEIPHDPVEASQTTSTQDRNPSRPTTQGLRPPHKSKRDVSSSIAGSLASARGISLNKQRRSGQPSSPAVAQQNVEGKIVIPSRRSKLGDAPLDATHENTTLSEKPPVIQPLAQSQSTKEAKSKEIALDNAPKNSDDAFNRFYTTFETLFSKLSAPLAFAGLPLNLDVDDDTTNEPTIPIKRLPKSPATQPKSSRVPSSRAPSSRRVTAEPAYSQLFSPASLAAVREEAGNTGLGAPGESFYVVPSTGGTMPYASILKRQQNKIERHHDRTLSRDSTGLSEDLEEFVDARESPGSESPVVSRTRKRGSNIKTTEELQLENESLRGVLDEMSRRLWQFEMGAQMGSVALHQSIHASVNHGLSGNGSHVANNDVADGRLAVLEEDMMVHKMEIERMARENEKLKGVVGRYRDRWERLKEGARTRRQPGPGDVGKEMSGVNEA